MAAFPTAPTDVIGTDWVAEASAASPTGYVWARPAATAGETDTHVPVQDEGGQVSANPNALNFVGEGVTATDIAGVATITIPGSAVEEPTYIANHGLTAADIGKPVGGKADRTWRVIDDTLAPDATDFADAAAVLIFDVDANNVFLAGEGDEATVPTTMLPGVPADITSDNDRYRYWDLSLNQYVKDKPADSAAHVTEVIYLQDAIEGDPGTWSVRVIGPDTPGAAVESILDLTDTPGTYGTTGQALVVNGAADGLEWGGATATANDRQFASATAVGATDPANPELSDILVWVLANTITDTHVYYTGTDNAADTPTYVYLVDASSNVTQVEEPGAAGDTYQGYDKVYLSAAGDTALTLAHNAKEINLQGAGGLTLDANVADDTFVCAVVNNNATERTLTLTNYFGAYLRTGSAVRDINPTVIIPANTTYWISSAGPILNIIQTNVSKHREVLTIVLTDQLPALTHTVTKLDQISLFVNGVAYFPDSSPGVTFDVGSNTILWDSLVTTFILTSADFIVAEYF